MASTIVKTVFQFRRDITENWLANKDVVPAAGEPCFDLDMRTLKIGDGETTYENLPAIGGVELKVEADGKSIVLKDNVFQLMGFAAAEVGAQPRKNADGSIEWVVPSTETVEGLQSAVAGLQSDVTNLQTNVTEITQIIMPSEEGAVSLLDRVAGLENKMDGTGEGTVDAKIDAKINEFAARVTDDGTINTIQELCTYVAEHGTEVADMAADIIALQELVGSMSVADQIAAAGHLTEEEAKAILLAKDDAKAIFQGVRYEISHKPEGTLVNVIDKEIRVMCPTDTQWALQNSGEGADASKYYIGFKAYAPTNAVSFKEGLSEVITDNTMYYFENNDFAGIDAYGRKYSIVWLPVAAYDHDTASWTYYGKSSSVSKYIGWYYSVEWYNEAGKKIAADTIRINLSNEDCHSTAIPYYAYNSIKEVSVAGTVLDVVDGKVDIPVGAGMQFSDEFIVNDGVVEVGVISFSKIAQIPGETVIFDGGGAAE